MHVLVIGGNRFVGLLTTWRLLAGGHAVTLLNRGSRPDPFGDRVTRLVGDRRADLDRLVAGRSFDAAIDLAAFDGDDVRGAVRALGDRVARYLLISSGQVYLLRAPRPDGAAREADYDGALMTRPSAADDASEWDYGAGKRDAEDALASAARAGFPGNALRIPMVHGELDYHRRLEAYLWRLVDGGPILVADPDRQVRHVYGGAVARTLVELCGAALPPGRAFNLCQRETPTLAELIVRLGDAVGARARIVEVTAAALAGAGLARREVSPLSSRWMSFLDPSRAEAELGFRHEPLETYLGHIAACFLAHPPTTPPDGYRHRARELALAAA